MPDCKKKKRKKRRKKKTKKPYLDKKNIKIQKKSFELVIEKKHLRMFVGVGGPKKQVSSDFFFF